MYSLLVLSGQYTQSKPSLQRSLGTVKKKISTNKKESRNRKNMFKFSNTQIKKTNILLQWDNWKHLPAAFFSLGLVVWNSFECIFIDLQCYHCHFQSRANDIAGAFYCPLYRGIVQDSHIAASHASNSSSKRIAISFNILLGYKSSSVLACFPFLWRLFEGNWIEFPLSNIVGMFTAAFVWVRLSTRNYRLVIIVQPPDLFFVVFFWQNDFY